MTNEMECVEARTVLLGRETERFSEEKITSAESHVVSCGECARYFQYNTQFQKLLKEKVGHVTTPPMVRESLLGEINNPHGKKTKIERAIPLPRSWLSRVAAIVLLLTAGSIGIYFGLLQHQDRTSSLLPSLLVQDHIEIQMREQPFDIQTSDRLELEQWFGKRVDFAVSIPTLPGTKLRGGRLCYLFDRRAAFIVFEKENKPISTYILDGSGIDLSSIGTMSVHKDNGVRCVSEKGFNVVLWETNGVIYALVSSLHPDELESLAASL